MLVKNKPCWFVFLKHFYWKPDLTSRALRANTSLALSLPLSLSLSHSLTHAHSNIMFESMAEQITKFVLPNDTQKVRNILHATFLISATYIGRRTVCVHRAVTGWSLDLSCLEGSSYFQTAQNQHITSPEKQTSRDGSQVCRWTASLPDIQLENLKVSWSARHTDSQTGFCCVVSVDC